MKTTAITPAGLEQPSPDIWPTLGQWYWVKYDEDYDENYKRVKGPVELLMCCNHIGSNHAKFTMHRRDSTSEDHVMDVEMSTRIRHEPNWKSIIERRIADKQAELTDSIRALADQCSNASLLPQPGGSVEANPLAVVAHSDPNNQKKALLNLQDKILPATKKAIDQMTKALISEHKNLFLAELEIADKIMEAANGIKDRLFALELYAGFEEQVLQIADGKPAPQETPITIRQMLRYMDEETLIDAEDGGMDFKNLKDFDKWAVANIDSVAPEPRCIVAFQIRRNLKDYGPCRDIGTALKHIQWHENNTLTYLLIRNGQRVYRISTELDFRPRLLAFREQFNKPFEKEGRDWSGETVQERTFGKKVQQPITPKDYEYDRAVEERAETMKHYNRMLFIIQGLLDRSPVFEPHPIIALADPDAAQRWITPNHDEEDGLPNSNPPKWEEYQTAMNATLKRDSIVFAAFEYRDARASWRVREEDRWHRNSGYFRVVSISRDKKKITISEPGGTRYGYEHKDPHGSGYYGKYGEWPIKKRKRYTVDMAEVFAVEAYEPGDYKPFLCDAHLKGAYLRWSPFLLKAERFHKMTTEEKSNI